jgi:hypothetical protein
MVETWQDDKGNSFTIDGQVIVFNDGPYWKNNFGIVSVETYDFCLSNGGCILSVKASEKSLVLKKLAPTYDFWVINNEKGPHIFKRSN